MCQIFLLDAGVSLLPFFLRIIGNPKIFTDPGLQEIRHSLVCRCGHAFNTRVVGCKSLWSGPA